MRLRNIPFLLGVAGASVLLAVLQTSPLAAHLGTHLIGTGLGDNVSFVWNLWWMREALASSAYDYLTCPLMTWPLGASVLLHTHTWLNAAAGATLLAALPVTTAQNVLVIASLALNGLAAFVLAATVTGARWPSAIAGALVLTTPAIAMRLMGHYNLLMAWPLLLAMAALVFWWRAPGTGRGLLLGSTAALVAYAESYYVVYFALFAVVYSATVLWRLELTATTRPHRPAARVLFVLAGVAACLGLAIALWPGTEATLGGLHISLRSPTNALTAAWLFLAAGMLVRWRVGARVTRASQEPLSRLAARLVVPVTLCAVLVTPLAVPAWRLWQAGDYVTQLSSLKSSPRGVDVATIVMGPPFDGRVGGTVRNAYRRFGIDPMESSAWLGVTPVLLLALLVSIETPDRDTRRWLVVAAVFAVWALGPYLTVLGSNTGLLLPQALARFIPIVDNARMPARAMLLVAAALAVAGAAAAARLPPGGTRHRLACLVAALAVLETLAAPLPLTRVPDAGVWARMPAGVERGAVLTLPFGVRDGFRERGLVEHDALYGQMRTGRPLVGGFLARLPPRVWTWYETHQPFSTLLDLSEGLTPADLPSCDVIRDGLLAAGVSTIVTYPADMPGALRAFVDERMPVRPGDADGTRRAFVIDPHGCERRATPVPAYAPHP